MKIKFLDGTEREFNSLRKANLRGANLRGANLSEANLRGADMCEANLRGATGLPLAPVVENIDSKILAAIEGGGQLDMARWHSCETTHCRAGWAITLAGEAGRKLESETSSYMAGRLIYEVSRPGKPAPDFYATDKAALTAIREDAGQ